MMLLRETETKEGTREQQGLLSFCPEFVCNGDTREEGENKRKGKGRKQWREKMLAGRHVLKNKTWWVSLFLGIVWNNPWIGSIKF